MRKRWTPGDPCPVCKKPVEAQADRYKRDKSTCKPCGNQAKQAERDAERALFAIACRDCNTLMLDGNDRRYGACKECRRKQRVRYCKCGAEIAQGRKALNCDDCTASRRAAGAQKGTQAMAAKRAAQRELREATRLPVDPPRPVAQAWPGLRGPGGEWESGVTTVQGWATLDGGRL